MREGDAALRVQIRGGGVPDNLRALNAMADLLAELGPLRRGAPWLLAAVAAQARKLRSALGRTLPAAGVRLGPTT
jgi:hypothetical protein